MLRLIPQQLFTPHDKPTLAQTTTTQDHQLSQDLARANVARDELQSHVLRITAEFHEEVEKQAVLERELENTRQRSLEREHSLTRLTSDLDAAQESIRYLEKENLQLHAVVESNKDLNLNHVPTTNHLTEKENIRFPAAPMSSSKKNLNYSPETKKKKSSLRHSIDEVTPDCKQQ